MRRQRRAGHADGLSGAVQQVQMSGQPRDPVARLKGRGLGRVEDEGMSTDPLDSVDLPSVRGLAKMLCKMAGMPEPSVHPIEGGGLQIEWDDDEAQMHVAIEVHGDAAAMLVEHKGEVLGVVEGAIK